MAFTNKTVGAAGSGADFAGAASLQLWEEAQDTLGGEQRAQLITDIVDDVVFTGWPAGSIIEIVSDVAGVQRTITTPSSGQHIYRIVDANITTFDCLDITLDGTLQAANRHGVNSETGVTSLTLIRVRVTSCSSRGVFIQSGSLTATVNCENCIFEDSGFEGVLLQFVASASTNTFTNCLSFGNGGDGFECADDANITRVFDNSIDSVTKRLDLPSCSMCFRNRTTNQHSTKKKGSCDSISAGARNTGPLHLGQEQKFDSGQCVLRVVCAPDFPVPFKKYVGRVHPYTIMSLHRSIFFPVHNNDRDILPNFLYSWFVSLAGIAVIYSEN